MELSENEMFEVNELFKEVNKLFYNKTKATSVDYTEIRFEKENDYRYFKFKYRNLEFEIYYLNGVFDFNICDNSLINDEILKLIKYIKTNFLLLFNREIEEGKIINMTFDSGDLKEILLARSRKRNNLI